MDKKQYVYIVRCADGTLYTGWTTDVEKRVAVHNSGRGAKYTRSRRPVVLVYFEEFDGKAEAQKREYAVKRLTRQEKEKLIRSGCRDAGSETGGIAASAGTADGAASGRAADKGEKNA